MFSFEPYRSPFSNSIAETILRRGDIAARQAQTVGAAQAQAAERSGAGWANALLGTSQAVAAIPGQIQQQKAQQQESQMRDLQVKAAQRQQADIDALDKAYMIGGTDRNAILNNLPGHQRPQVQKAFTDADESSLKVQKLKDETAVAERDYFGSLAAGVRPFLDSEDGGLSAAMLALQHAKEKGYADADRLWQQVKADPSKLRQMVDQLIMASPKQVELINATRTADARVLSSKTGADRLELEKPKIEAETQRVLQQVEGTVPMTAAQKAAQETQLRQLGVSESRLKLEQKKFDQQQTDKTDLSAAGLDAAAMNYAKTGSLPPLGMGDKTTRKSIINRAAELMPGLDIATAKADYEANRKSLDGLQKQRDAIGAFENTAKKNIDIFLSQAGKVVDTGSPLLNQPVRMITGRLLGSPDQAAFDAARQVAVNEIAKITTNPNLSGTLSDAARHEVEAFNPQSATLKQTVAVMKLLKQDMENRTSALDEQIAGIRGRISKAETKTPKDDTKDGPRIGERRMINGKLGEWDGKGWKAVQ